jgi:glycine cleavage system aminomethyltransferase T
LQRLTDADLSDDAFPFLSVRRIEAGWAQPWALRVSYTGELGWELYVPTEFVADLYDRVIGAGKDVELRHAGGFAFDGLRLERGFRSWGHDMGPLDDPYEVGLGFAVRSTKDFVGCDALRERKDGPRDRRLLSVRLDDPAPMLWHAESVLSGDERVGHVTSGAYGHTLGSAVGLAWVHGEVSLDAPVTVEVRNRKVPATISSKPFYMPAG